MILCCSSFERTYLLREKKECLMVMMCMYKNWIKLFHKIKKTICIHVWKTKQVYVEC